MARARKERPLESFELASERFAMALRDVARARVEAIKQAHAAHAAAVAEARNQYYGSAAR